MTPLEQRVERFDAHTQRLLVSTLQRHEAIAAPVPGHDGCFVPSDQQLMSESSPQQVERFLRFVDSIPSLVASVGLRIVPVDRAEIQSVDPRLFGRSVAPECVRAIRDLPALLRVAGLGLAAR